MDFTPLADPFIIRFQRDGIEYQAKVTYAKALHSCSNIFNVEVLWPQGIQPFCLKEKPDHQGEEDVMVWSDAEGRESVFYQVIGEEIASYMRNRLGIVLLDTPLANRDEESENF